MKRIVLFLVTNLAVMLVLSIVLQLLGVDRFLMQNGLNVGTLLVFSLVVGFRGSIISLLISKPMAKWSTGAQVIETPAVARRAVAREHGASASPTRPASACRKSRSTRASPMPSPPARSATRRWWPCPPACSQSMSREEVEAVLGHEIGARRQRRHGDAHADPGRGEHVRGVPLARRRLRRRQGRVQDRARRRASGYYITVIVCQIVFGILASIIVAWFSRQREFRADAGSARPARPRRAR